MIDQILRRAGFFVRYDGRCFTHSEDGEVTEEAKNFINLLISEIHEWCKENGGLQDEYDLKELKQYLEIGK
jgi:hypothetical protein